VIKPHTCPICRRRLAANASRELETFPFCSERCRRIDYFRWAEGRYAIVEPLDPARHDLESLPEEADPPE
jgi:endogenous inhibitor of DNA gyrase (YacG/DUF329 family)